MRSGAVAQWLNPCLVHIFRSSMWVAGHHPCLQAHAQEAGLEVEVELGSRPCDRECMHRKQWHDLLGHSAHPCNLFSFRNGHF